MSSHEDANCLHCGMPPHRELTDAEREALRTSVVYCTECSESEESTEIRYITDQADDMLVGVCSACAERDLWGNRPVRAAFLQGDIAATIVKNIFNEFRFDTRPYGYEDVIPDLLADAKRVKDETAEQVRGMPDLLVMDRLEAIDRGRRMFFVEVKSTHKKELSISHALRYHQFWPNTHVVIVSLSDQQLYAFKFADRFPTEKDGAKLDFVDAPIKLDECLTMDTHFRLHRNHFRRVRQLAFATLTAMSNPTPASRTCRA